MKETTLPLYAKLKESIINAIATGELKPGDKLPSHEELCERYNISYMTMRRAISDLTNEGVLITIQGKGTYVAEIKVTAETSGLRSFTEDMKHRGLSSTSKVLEAKIVAASTVMMQVLNVQVGEPLVLLKRVRYANNQPLAIQIAYLPEKLCPGLLDYDWSKNSLYEILNRDFHLQIASSTGTAGAALASEEEAETLQIRQPAALLVTERITYLADGTALEYARSLYCADRYQIPLQE